MSKWILIAVALLVSGCETHKTQKVLQATGGSRADGTVALSYEYGWYETPVVDMSQAGATAAQACSGWGYEGVEPFGGQTNQCQAFGEYGTCLQTLVTVTYQCTGAPSAAE